MKLPRKIYVNVLLNDFLSIQLLSWSNDQGMSFTHALRYCTSSDVASQIMKFIFNYGINEKIIEGTIALHNSSKECTLWQKLPFDMLGIDSHPNQRIV